MYSISAKQIRAARSLLDWSQSHLAAKAGLSVTTIRNLEAGDLSPRCSSAKMTAQTIEKAGIEFIDHEGVRRRPNKVTCYEGIDSCDRFFEDLLGAIKEEGTEIYCAFTSLNIFLQCCNINGGNIDLFKKLNERAIIKCLLPQLPAPSLSIPSFKIRTASPDLIGVETRIVYGNNHSIIVTEDDGTPRFIVINSLTLAQDNKKHFLSLWEQATSSPAHGPNLERHAV